jgi:putative transposase
VANTYVQQRVHLIWTTLNRQDFLAPELRTPLWSFFGGVIRHHGGVLFIAGGVEDHVHLYAEYPKTIALSQFVSLIKAHSSRWMRETYASMAGFHWQSGYAGFSVQGRGDAALREYIANQEEHHQRTTFNDEYLAILNRHGITFDPKYVFDQAIARE